MIVYRVQERVEDTRTLLARLRDTADTRDLLIGFGELESGVADALFPDRDGLDKVTSALRDVSIEIGRAFFRRTRVPNALERIANAAVPERVRIGVPEGYAYYALYPEAYLEAARRFHAEAAPAAATVIGIRSIGTSLSAAVAGTLAESGCETAAYTVRPRGHPFERRIEAEPELEAALRARAGSWFAVVDEGPGLSGSSFASVAAWLSGLGIPDGRIVLFPSWEPDGSAFLSETARTSWRRHRKYTVPFENVWQAPWPELTDISAGKWRELVYAQEDDRPAANPQHERRKYLRRGGEPAMLRFAGLGEYGRARRDLAAHLAEAGFCPAVHGVYDGFLATRFETGRPLTPASLNAESIERMAAYLAFRQRTLPADRGTGFDGLCEMMRVNAGAAPFEDMRWVVEDAGTVAVDGRMMPHEWIETERGLLKMDAIDHHDDHFHPGNQDIAWDLAGCAIEFGMPADAERQLVESYIRRSADGMIRRRMRFYRGAYAAFRLGYAEMSAAALAGTPEAQRFQRLAGRYRDAFAAAAEPPRKRRTE